MNRFKTREYWITKINELADVLMIIGVFEAIRNLLGSPPPSLYESLAAVATGFVLKVGYAALCDPTRQSNRK